MADGMQKVAWDARQKYAETLGDLIRSFCNSMVNSNYITSMIIIRNYYTIAKPFIRDNDHSEIEVEINMCQRNVDKLRNSNSANAVATILREDMHKLFQTIIDKSKHLIMPIEEDKYTKLDEDTFFR